MRQSEFAPFYRSTIGFDRLIQLMDKASGFEADTGYPPYNIERSGDNVYVISVAVAGFDPSELTVDVKETTLTISGAKAEDKDARVFLHRGIAARSFERRFQLADHVDVKSAAFENGLLNVTLVRELPERLKARKIAISAAAEPRQIETQAAAA